MSSTEIKDEKNIKIDENLQEIINKIKKEKKLSKEEILKLESDAKQSVEFLSLIDNIKLPIDKYVVFTDGEEQLIYEDGEFFVTSSTDSTKLKKKKKRSEATDMYIEYFIRYILNRINKQKEMDILVREISSNGTRENNKESIEKIANNNINEEIEYNITIEPKKENTNKNKDILKKGKGEIVR